jgi:predicted anti-sigma-YlaC factor YlaD
MTNESEQQETLTCQEVVELVTDYLEHALLPKTQALFEEHLAGCDGCATYTNQIQQTIMMLRQLTQEPIFPETKRELLEIFQSWKKAS